MRRKLYLLISALAISVITLGQSSDPLVSDCVMNAGTGARYLKDFRIQLGKTTAQGEMRYKASMSLWKNTKYRFTVCNADDSKGQLYFNLKDDTDRIVASSLEQKTGKTYPFVDFLCNKSGIYKLNYDFTGGEQGSGVGVVSMIK